MTKSELRKIYLAKQSSLSREDRAAESRQISDRFFREFDLETIKFLHCFIAIEKFNEVDTTLIFERLWREFPRVTTVVPRVDIETDEMQSLKFTSGTSLVKNVWDIDEPTHDECIETELIDIVLVPLLCFDEAGHRVGYGKGFYDRFLSRCRMDCLKIGLSFFSPVEAIDDAGSLDVELDFCIMADTVLASKK